MKSIKMFSLAALAALMAMAFAGASSAMAEGSTALCKVDESPCVTGNIITHLHGESIGHGLLLSSFATIECDVLALGDVLGSGLGNPLIIHGTATFTCLDGCTAEEENGPGETKVLRLGSELAVVSGEALVHVVCGLNCRYNGVGMEGNVLGALLAANELGENENTEGVANKESGFFCPSTTELDGTGAPLIPTYISS